MPGAHPHRRHSLKSPPTRLGHAAGAHGAHAWGTPRTPFHCSSHPTNSLGATGREQAGASGEERSAGRRLTASASLLNYRQGDPTCVQYALL